MKCLDIKETEDQATVWILYSGSWLATNKR